MKYLCDPQKWCYNGGQPREQEESEMYCSNCGTQNPELNSVCVKCGAGLNQAIGAGPAPTQPSVTAASPTQRTSGMATASLILGIASFFLNILLIPSILAIVFGVMARNQIKRDPGLGGAVMAKAGLICGIVAAVLWVVFILLYMVFIVWTIMTYGYTPAHL
jgi:hypothetical protein